MQRTLADRLWARVDFNGPVPAHRPELGPCHIWTGAINKHTGYGIIRVSYKRRGDRVHRVAYALTKGPVPPGKLVMHECDVKRCCNGDHLVAGTQQENLRAARERGLAAFGERSGNARLTDALVSSARARVLAGETVRSVAREYEVAESGLWNAVYGKTWSHVEAPCPGVGSGNARRVAAIRADRSLSLPDGWDAL